MNASLSSSSIADARLESAPIPSEWVIEGGPAARVAELSRSADGTAMTAVWDCTDGAFNWYFGGDETVHILEGEVTVSQEACAARCAPATSPSSPPGLGRAGT